MSWPACHGWYGTEGCSLYLSQSASQNAACSGVTFDNSERVIELRVNGAGLMGKGCVGDVHSPAAVVCGTGRSSMPKIGSPVSRLKMKSSDIFVCCTTAGITCPFRRTSMSAGAADRS